MQIATVVISAFGLLFAAIAASKAVEAVRLTRQARHEEQLRRLREALITVEHAAAGLLGTIGGGPFAVARLELKRARSLGVVLPNELEEILARLVAADAASNARLPSTKEDAQRAWLVLSTQGPPPLMPRWYRIGLGRFYAHRARRKS